MLKKIDLNEQIIYLTDCIDFELENQQEYLTIKEIDRLNSMKNEKSKLQFYTSRKLRTQAIGKQEISYRENGSPSTNEYPFISITHTKKEAGFSYSKYPCSIDLEQKSEKAMRVQHKFISIEEAKIFPRNNPDACTLLWSLKETLYKLSDINGLIFLVDLKVFLMKGKLHGNIIRNGRNHKVELNFREFENFFLTFAVFKD